jgi:hypothetical protein
MIVDASRTVLGSDCESVTAHADAYGALCDVSEGRSFARRRACVLKLGLHVRAKEAAWMKCRWCAWAFLCKHPLMKLAGLRGPRSEFPCGHIQEMRLAAISVRHAESNARSWLEDIDRDALPAEGEKVHRDGGS